MSMKASILRGSTLVLSLLAALGAVGSGCERELEGAPCPCASGYVCCTASNTCVSEPERCSLADPAAPEVAGAGGTGSGSAGAPGGGGSDAPGEPRGSNPPGHSFDELLDAGSAPSEDAGGERGAPDAGFSGGGASGGGVSGGGASGGGASGGAGASGGVGASGGDTPDASLAPPEGTDPPPTTDADGGSCAHIVFCDAAGPEGTVCAAESCSLRGALDDCIEDTYFVCGTPVQPWVLRTAEGDTLPVSDPPSAE